MKTRGGRGSLWIQPSTLTPQPTELQGLTVVAIVIIADAVVSVVVGVDAEEARLRHAAQHRLTLRHPTCYYTAPSPRALLASKNDPAVSRPSLIYSPPPPTAALPLIVIEPCEFQIASAAAPPTFSRLAGTAHTTGFVWPAPERGMLTSS